MGKEIFIVGIDEAGRGPLAGPVCVGAVGVKITTDKNLEAKLPSALVRLKEVIIKFYA